MKDLALIFVVLAGISPAVAQHSNYDPMPGKFPTQSSGFIDSTLGLINSNNTDYGCHIDAGRQFLVEQTLHSLEFWVIGIAVSLLIVSFFMLLHQSREQDRREIIAAGLLAQYHNAWIDARSHAETAIHRHNDLVRRSNAAAESALRTPFQQADQTTTNSEQTRSFGTKTSSAKHLAALNGGARFPENRGSRGCSSRQVNEPECDPIAQIGVLQKQLEASRERETNLQKQLAAAERRCSFPQSNSTAMSG